MGKPIGKWENHRKTIGKPQENRRKMGKSQENHRKMGKSQDFPWENGDLPSGKLVHNELEHHPPIHGKNISFFDWAMASMANCNSHHQRVNFHFPVAFPMAFDMVIFLCKAIFSVAMCVYQRFFLPILPTFQASRFERFSLAEHIFELGLVLQLSISIP